MRTLDTKVIYKSLPRLTRSSWDCYELKPDLVKDYIDLFHDRAIKVNVLNNANHLSKIELNEN